jgi:hypothetical protein
MRTNPRPQTRDRCRCCGRELPAWLPVAKRHKGVMLVHHLSAGPLAEFQHTLECRVHSD